MAFQDETFRDGYQPYSRSTFAPLQQPGQYADAFGEDSKPSSRFQGGPSGPSDATPSMPAAPQAGGTTTFAQLQAQGIARPAPPVGGLFGMQQQGGPVHGALQQAILGALGNPSRYGADQAKATFDRLSGAIDDDYDLRVRKNDETMAKRGLYDSTINSGALSDLNVGRRTAKIDLADRIAEEQARTYQQDRASAIAQALGFTGQEQQGYQNQNATLIALLQALSGGNLGQLGQLGQSPSPYDIGGPGGFGVPQVYDPSYWGLL